MPIKLEICPPIDGGSGLYVLWYSCPLTVGLETTLVPHGSGQIGGLEQQVL